MLIRASNNSGMVLVTVLMFVISISIVTIAILSQSVSQATSAQDKVDQIKAQELAQGAYAKAYVDMNKGLGLPSFTYQYLDGKPFATAITPQGAGKYSVGVSY